MDKSLVQQETAAPKIKGRILLCPPLENRTTEQVTIECDMARIALDNMMDVDIDHRPLKPTEYQDSEEKWEILALKKFIKRLLSNKTVMFLNGWENDRICQTIKSICDTFNIDTCFAKDVIPDYLDGSKTLHTSEAEDAFKVTPHEE